MTAHVEAQESGALLPERTPSERQESEDRILRFATSVRWQSARTMPHVPHEYTVLKWRPELRDEFVWFARYVLRYGKVESSGNDRKSYYYVRRHKFWTMDDPIGSTDLINRESTTDVPCRVGVLCEH